MTLTPPRLRLLLLLTACNLGVWTLAAFFATSEFYRRSLVLGGGAEWSESLQFQLVTSLNWALFTPLVVFIAERLPVRSSHRIRNTAITVALIPLLAAIRVSWGSLMVNYGEGQPFSEELLKKSFQIRTHRWIAIMAAIFFIYHLVQAQREAAAHERQRVRAQTLLARTKLDELRTRLQPQFALRMLRHIGGVMHDQPKAADSLIVTLSGILRRSMGRGGDERIRLADELEHFDHCLDLCRTGGRFALTARYVADDDVLACHVPALVLQPVIEAVVLDLTAGTGGSVDVRCERQGDETRVEVCWTVAPGGAAATTNLRIPCQEAPA